MTVTGKKFLLVLSLLLVCLDLFSPGFLSAGNKAMVEKRVTELDELNKQAVQQVTGLPRDGVIELKAHVKPGEEQPSIEIIEKRVTIQERPITFKSDNSTAAESAPEEGSDDSKKP